MLFTSGVAYDPRSAAVIGLCIGAVLLAAVLFPVAGIDGAPANSAETDGGTPGTPTSDGSTTDGSSDGSAGDGTDDGSDTGGDDGSSDDDTGDADAGSDDSSTSDDPSGTDDSAGSDEQATDEETVPIGQAFLRAFFRGVVFVLVIVIVILGGVFAAMRDPGSSSPAGGELGPLPDGPLPRLRFRLSRIPQVAMLATIGFARQATAAWTAFAVLGRTIVRSGLLVGAGVGTVFRSLTALSIGFPSIPRPRLPAIGWPGGAAGGTDGSRPRRESTSIGEATSTAQEEVYTEPETVEEAWRRLVASLAVRRPSVRTPRECAAIALDAGLPRDAVERLTATFEAVRYGGAARTPTRLERAREAYARIREARGGDSQ